jgi:hypothetical protein
MTSKHDSAVSAREPETKHSSMPGDRDHHMRKALHLNIPCKRQQDAQCPQAATTQDAIRPRSRQTVRSSATQFSYSKTPVDHPSPTPPQQQHDAQPQTSTSQVLPRGGDVSSFTSFYQRSTMINPWSYEDYKRTRLMEWVRLTEGGLNRSGYDSEGN